MATATMIAPEVATAAITLTEAAAVEIKCLLEQQGMASAALRVYVEGGGCGGYQYGMALSDEIEEGDTEFVQHGVRVLVDEWSMDRIKGASIDYVEDEMLGGGFKIENPNAKGGCGCGSSFSTEDGAASGGGCGSGCGSGGCGS